MGLLGKAAVAIWSDMADPPAHDAWHSREHLPERIGIPGFLRARRCVAADGGDPRYFVLYDVADAAVMMSEGYLARLNAPTPWTRVTMEQVRSLSRTLCRVEKTEGIGTGAVLAATPLTPAEGSAQRLRDWIVHDLWQVLMARQDAIGLNLLQRDEATVRPDTLERQLRKHEDGAADWILIVEGYDGAAIEKVACALLTASDLSRQGAAEVGKTRVYRLAHVAHHGDLAGNVSTRQK